MKPFSLVVGVAVPVLVAACAGLVTHPAGSGAGDAGSDASGRDGAAPASSGSSGSSGGILLPSTCSPTSPCTDFTNVAGVTCSGGECVALDTTGTLPLPTNPGSLFANPSPSGGPCLVEPQDGTLFPNGWLRPRISFAPVSSSQNVFQIRLHSDSELDDLVVYTTNTNITLPKPLWVALSQNLVGPTVSVSVTAANASGGDAAASPAVSFAIAPVVAEGALIYWATESFDDNATSTMLKGLQVGAEVTTVALTTGQVTQTVDADPADGGPLSSGRVGVHCIGCHTATPDGSYLAFTAQFPWPNALAAVSAAADASVPIGQPPPWLAAGAAANLSPMFGPASGGSLAFDAPPVVNQVMLGIQTFSPVHYATGDRVVVSQLGAAETTAEGDAGSTTSGVVSQLAWFDLEWDGAPPTTGLASAPCGSDPAPAATCLPPQASNGGWGILARNGDARSAGAPSWSHGLHGATDLIAYTSTDVGTRDGRLDQGNADIYTVPYNDRQGGAAIPVPGASDPSFNEYYPAWSPDDQLIAFNRVPSGYSMYDQPQAEVYVVASSTVSCDGVESAQCRLKANDPVACTGSKSPGVQNTWPRWGPLPNVESVGSSTNLGGDGKLYYWVTFSSTRATACTMTAASGALNTLCTPAQSAAAAGRAQLYVASLVVDPTSGAITTYPAIYLWSQDEGTDNLIPAWDRFTLPTIPPIAPVPGSP